MCGLFIILEEIGFSSYTDDNTPFVEEATSENVVSYLESCAATLSAWFWNNQMKSKPEKCHLLMLTGQLPLKQVNTLYQTVIGKYCLVLKLIVNSILTIILK